MGLINIYPYEPLAGAHATLIPTQNRANPLAARPTRAVKPRKWLLAAAAATTLSYGIPAEVSARPVWATCLWMIRASGAVCALVALQRDPRYELYDPVAELKSLHHLQLQRMQDNQHALIQQEVMQVQQQMQQHFAAQLQQEKQAVIDHYGTLLHQSRADVSRLQQENLTLSEQLNVQQVSWQRQWDSLERQVAELEAAKNQLKAEREQLHAWVETESARHSAEYESAKRALQAERDALHAWVLEQAEEQTKVDRENHAALEARQAKMERVLEERREEYLREVDEHLAEVQANYQHRIEKLQKLIDEQESTIADLKLIIYNLQQPELINGSSTFELIADRIIQFLYEHGVIVREPRVVSYSQRHKFELSFAILPIVPGKNDKGKFAQSLLDAYTRIQSKLLEGIPAVVPDCKQKPSAELGNRRISLLIDVSGVNWDERNKVDPIVEAAPDWLMEVVRVANHFRICGESDSGKSTLMDNIVGAMQQIWSELKLTVADPKYPFTEWKTFTPDYKGFEEVFDAIFALENLIDTRFALARRAVDAGHPIPDFPPHLVAFDELEISIDEARAIDEANPPRRGQVFLQNRVVRALRKGLKMGRGLTKQKGQGLKVAYIAQSPLCTRLRMNRDDFYQSANFFLGEVIPRALEGELDGLISSADKAALLQQYYLRVERGDKYFALVKVPGKKAFIATLPEPGHYAVATIETGKVPIDSSVALLEPLLIEEYEAMDAEDAEDLDDQRLSLEELFQKGSHSLEDEAQPAPDLTDLPEHGLELLGYVYGRGQRHKDEAGWFLVSKLRDNWGKDKGLSTGDLKALLQALTARQLGEFEAGESRWRATIDPRFLPRHQE
jgi:hypothetical protein